MAQRVCPQANVYIEIPHGRLLQARVGRCFRNDIGDSVKGAGSLAYKHIKVLEYLYTGKAIFEEDEAGAVKRLGMEMSPELADSEAAKVDAKAGMIWFEKS